MVFKHLPPLRAAPRIEPAETPMVIEDEPRSDEYQLWAEKYRPTQFNQLVGNKNEIAKLRTWLEAW